jgi:phospholipase A1
MKKLITPLLLLSSSLFAVGDIKDLHIYKPNYLLPYTVASNDTNNNQSEVKFQISLYYTLVHGLAIDDSELNIAYTQQSFWQMYDHSNSSPFRETNYEPEIFYKFPITDTKDTYLSLGLSHQSNGQTMPKSRSWNRAYAKIEHKVTSYFDTSLKVWHRFAEEDKPTIDSPSGDDNPHITSYLGNFELDLVAHSDDWYFTNKIRNNLRDENRGSIETTIEYRVAKDLYLTFYNFNGYVDSLIDYNNSVHRYGVGITIR